MALEAASVALDIPTWAEWSTVSTNVGSLDTLSSCIDMVSSKLNRAPITATTKPSDAQVADFIARAKEELVEMKSFTFARRFVIGTMTASQYRYAVPPDCNRIIFLHDTTNDCEIPVVEPHAFDSIFPDPGSIGAGQPAIATQKNKELWICPAPDGSDIYEMEYERSGEDADPQDISWLPEIERFRCVDFALAESWELLNQFRNANYYSGKWAKHVGKGKRFDNKRKLKGARGRGLFG